MCEFASAANLKQLQQQHSFSMSLVLHYLDLRARAETIRLVLHYGGVEFQDHIIPRAEWVAGVKHDKKIAPFGQVPSLTLPNGDVIAETGAIIRLAARLAGIYPEDIYEAAKADMLFELVNTDLNVINPILNFYPLDSEAFKTNYDTYFQNLPFHLGNLTEILGDKQFFGGNSPHHGDFAVFFILFQIRTVKGDSLDGYPSLQAFVERVESLPAIRKYLDTRPKCKECGKPGTLIKTLDW